MKCKRTGFTLVELLTTLVIISMLVGLLLPALSMVRNNAKKAKQRAQFAAIGLALMAFKNDQGYYPPSDWLQPNYCGAQKLAEALLGWDLMGVHPDSHWQADGYNAATYEIRGFLPFAPGSYFFYDVTNAYAMDRRVGPYLELATTDAFRLGNSAAGVRDGLFDDTTPLEPSTFVLCDVFGVKKITLATGKTVKAGAPILYYRANTSSKSIVPPDLPLNRIYNVFDNRAIVEVKKNDDNKLHPLGEGPAPFYQGFYDFITDPKVTAMPWPYRPDSYILISAGVDGLYGTRDDITNF